MAVLARTKASIREGGTDQSASIDELETMEQVALRELGWLDAFESAVQDRDAREGVFASLLGLLPVSSTGTLPSTICPSTDRAKRPASGPGA